MNATPRKTPASAGQVARVMAEVAAIVARSGSADSLQVLLGSGFLHRLLEADPDQIDPAMFRQTISDEAYPPYLTHQTFEVELDTDLSWSRLEKEYDTVEVPRNRFSLGDPTGKRHKETFRLVSFSRLVQTEEAIAAFQARQWFPPFFSKVWALGPRLPECSPIEVRGREVVCLGEHPESGDGAHVISFQDDGRKRLQFSNVVSSCWLWQKNPLFLLKA